VSEDSSLSSRAGGPYRVVIADDHPLFRDALRQMIDEQPDLEVVGEARDGQEALVFCCRLRPELVLMDVKMPRLDGLAAARAIKRESPHTAVLILSAFFTPYYLSEAIKAGAVGYVLKYEEREQIIEAVRKVLGGEISLNQELAMRLLRRLLDEAPKHESPTPAHELSTEVRPVPAPLEMLTPRELEVLRMLVSGRTNQEISYTLFIGVSTVKKHVGQIIAKLGVSTRTEAAVKAIDLGVLSELQG